MSHLIEIKQPATTRSSKLITLERPSIPSPCKLSNRSFQHAAPQIWNSLPSIFRTPSYSSHLLSLSYNQFHKQLKTYLFENSFSSSDESRPKRMPPTYNTSYLNRFLDIGFQPYIGLLFLLPFGMDLVS